MLRLERSFFSRNCIHIQTSTKSGGGLNVLKAKGAAGKTTNWFVEIDVPAAFLSF